jgi:hypothetical protein
MSNRFAAGLSKIKESSGKAPPAQAEVEAAPASSQSAPSRRGKVVISAYFDAAVRQQFAILAIKHEKSQAAMMAEALNLLFERHGEPPIAKA